MFSRKEIKELMNQYVVVQLYTDVIPDRYQPTTTSEENTDLLYNRFKTEELPLYVILEPQENGGFRELSRYSRGLIRDAGHFARFLQKPLARQNQLARAEAGGG